MFDESRLVKKDPSDKGAPTAVPHQEVHHNDFHSALSSAMKTSPKVKEFVHLYEPHEYAGMKTYLSPDKSSGYAVKPDGDIVSVFSTVKGRGDHIMQHALQNGGSKLDAFDGYLPQFYSKHGFQEYKREKNWTPGGPDVVYMHRPNQQKMAASEQYMMAKAEDKSSFYVNKYTSKKQNLEKSEEQQAAHVFMAYDGDNAGRLIGRAVLADDANALHEASNRISHGHDIVREWVQANNGKVISGGGDEGTFVIPAEAANEIEGLRKDYEYATNLTMTVGVGQSLSQAGKALMVGKFRGKDQVCIYDESIEQELTQAQAHLSDGTATDEEKKLGDAYLKPEGAPMKESEPHNCEYCSEMSEANLQDEDHCQYCHNPASDEGDIAHCEYCAEAEQADAQHDPNAEGHPDDCQYCQEMSQPDHEHSGDDCEYCAQAEAQPDHDHTGDDCEYCAQAQSATPNDANAPADPHTEDGMSQLAQDIEATTQAGESPEDVVATLDGPQDIPGAAVEDNVSHTDNFDQNVPGDMGLAEDTVPEAGPDLAEVLHGGLQNHQESIQREKVMQMVSEALEGFKGCKDIIERAQQQAPQLYQSSIAMLKAMIEMAKMLGLAPQEQQPQEQPQQDPAQASPQEQPSNPQSMPQGDTSAGKALGR